MGSGVGESLSVTFQTTVTFFALNALAFYYDWRMGLFYLGSWPASIMGGVFLQKVKTDRHLLCGLLTYCS